MTENDTTTIDIHSILEVAKEAAHIAGDYLNLKLGSAKIEHQKSTNDDLLDIDLEAEHLILNKLHEKTPFIGILSEEIGKQGQQSLCWIIDPLDGSANFQHGNPVFAISIALVYNQQPIGGVIYLPTHHEMFFAMKGQGAYLNNTAIAVSQITTLSEAMTHAGDFTKEGDPELSSRRIKDILKLGAKTRRLRMIGSAATDLAYIACGRADILINHAPGTWDIAAGIIILQEAGGKFTSKQYDNGDTLYIFSNKLLHQPLEELLNEKPF